MSMAKGTSYQRLKLGNTQEAKKTTIKGYSKATPLVFCAEGGSVYGFDSGFDGCSGLDGIWIRMSFCMSAERASQPRPPRIES